jgi:single-strand DNA-binding protein
MASFNKITIVGYLGRDPELRHTPNGNSICNISVATTEKNRDKESTTWFKVAVWGKQGELCNQYLAKGSQIYIEGRLRSEEYTDRDGNKRTSLEVNATDVKFLGAKGDSRAEESTQKVTKEQVAKAFKEAEDADPLPF